MASRFERGRDHGPPTAPLLRGSDASAALGLPAGEAGLRPLRRVIRSTSTGVEWLQTLQAFLQARYHVVLDAAGGEADRVRHGDPRAGAVGDDDEPTQAEEIRA